LLIKQISPALYIESWLFNIFLPCTPEMSGTQHPVFNISAISSIYPRQQAMDYQQ